MQSPIPVNVKILNDLCTRDTLGYATENAVGMDLRACMEDDSVLIGPGERMAFGTGLAIEILRPDIAGFVYSRSGLGTKQGLVVSQGVGVIDPDYRGEIIVSLLNTSEDIRTVQRGQYIAQLLFQPTFQAEFNIVSELGTTKRGAGGFGHTDRGEGCVELVSQEG